MTKIYPLYKIVGVLSGCTYALAPNFEPRKITIIIKKFVEKAKSHGDISTLFEEYQTFYFFKNSEEGLEKLLREILFSIPEFLELNLTQREFEAGVTLNDEDRDTKIVFSTRYGSDVTGPEDDFIDLDAIIQNIIFNLNRIVDDQ